MTNVLIGPDTLACSSRAGHIYAIKTRSKLYGRERSLVVYTNRERGVKDADARNEALAILGRELDELSEKVFRVLKTQEEAERSFGQGGLVGKCRYAVASPWQSRTGGGHVW